MRQGKRLGRSSEKLLELEVEAEIAVVDRQPPGGRAGERLGRTRQPAKHSGRSLGGEGRITGQKLVGAVAAQDDLHLAACEPAQEMGRQDRRVAERLVEPACDLRQKLVDRLDRKRLLVMVGPQVTRDGAGVAALVEAGIFKADRKRADVPGGLDLAERGGDARGIDAAGEKNADRHVRAPVARDRVAELGPEPLGRRLEVELLGSRINRAIPVSRNPERAGFPAEGVSAGELLQRSPDRVGRRNVFVEQVARQARVVEASADVGMREHGLGLGAERQAAGRQLSVEERLLAHPVAHQNEPAAVGVPDRRGEHAVQPASELEALLFIEVDQALGVA